MRDENNPLINVLVSIELSQRKLLKEKSYETGLSVNYLIRTAIDDYFGEKSDD